MTTALAPGILWTYFLYAIILTVPVSLLLLYWYRRAVARSMRHTSGMQDASPERLTATSAGDDRTPT
jgi:membrane protein implicated in regulation of membrane protease activity